APRFTRKLLSMVMRSAPASISRFIYWGNHQYKRSAPNLSSRVIQCWEGGFHLVLAGNCLAPVAGDKRDANERVQRAADETRAPIGIAELGSARVKSVDFRVVVVIDDRLVCDGKARVWIGPASA